MSNRNRTLGILAISAAATLALPGFASAHAAVCGPDGSYRSDDARYTLVSVSPTGKATWSDGYNDPRVYPACPQPTPTPTPEPQPEPAPETTPPPVVVVTNPVVEPTPRKKPGRLIATKTVRTIRVVACAGPGTRGFQDIRTRVVWTRDGKVVKTKTRDHRRRGPVCATPAVTG